MQYINPTFTSDKKSEEAPPILSEPVYENQPAVRNPIRRFKHRSRSFGDLQKNEEQTYDQLSFPRYVKTPAAITTSVESQQLPDDLSRERIFSFGFSSFSSEPKRPGDGDQEDRNDVGYPSNYSLLYGHPRCCMCSRLLFFIISFLTIIFVSTSVLVALHALGVIGSSSFTGKDTVRGFGRCADLPCKNGATCLDLVNDHFCFCASGWTGDNCTTNVDECSASPCQNGGRCIDLVDDYICICLEAWTDKNCTTSIVGLPSTCWRMNKSLNESWLQSSILAPDSIDFSVNVDRYLTGYLLWGSMLGVGIYKVRALLKDDQNQQRAEASYNKYVSSTTYEALFSRPVLIRANRWYTAVAYIVGPPSHKGIAGEPFTQCNGWIVRFKTANGSRNGSDVTQGQIPALLLA